MITHSCTVEFTFQVNSNMREQEIRDIITNSEGEFQHQMAIALGSELHEEDSAEVVNAVWIEHEENSIKPGSVGELYEKEIGVLENMDDRKSMGEMPVDSECGNDCAKAIYAGRDFLNYVKQGFGEDFNVADNVRFAIRRTCMVYICG